MTKFQTIYIKPMTWAGKTKFYVGDQPSDVTRDHCSRLGRYIYRTDSLDDARSYARWAGKQTIECESFVGY